MNKRETIQEDRLRAEWAAEQQTMQSSAIRAAELVAVCTAAIAFPVGLLQITLNGTLALGMRIWLLVLRGAGLTLFTLLIIGGSGGHLPHVGAHTEAQLLQ